MSVIRRIEKTVFVSYRRADAPWALAVFAYLTPHGYDVFIDYDGIASGNFEAVGDQTDITTCRFDSSE